MTWSLQPTLSVFSLSIEFMVALLAFSFSRAPGWRHVAPFTLVALTAGGYSLVNVALWYVTTPFPDGGLLVRVNLMLAHLHCAAWMLYLRRGGPGRLPVSARTLQGLGGMFVLLAVVSLHPSMVVAASREVVSEVAPGSMQSLLAISPVASGLVALAPLSLLIPFIAYIRAAREKQPGAWGGIFAFSLFFAFSTLELLVAAQVLDLPYLAELGFLAIVLHVISALVRQAAYEATTLRTLSNSLEEQVAARTAEVVAANGALHASERLASIGRLAEGLGHQVNNPLSFVLDGLGRLADPRGEPPATERRLIAAEALLGARRIQRVVGELRAHQTALRERRRTPVVVQDEVAESVRRFQGAYPGVVVHTEWGRAPIVAANRALLADALRRVLINAAEAVAGAVPTSGEAQVRVRTGSTPAGEAVVEVTDRGPGVAPEHLSRLADPYFTTRADAGALGLGLFVATGILQAHGGRLELESVPGQGTTARFKLPPASGALLTLGEVPAPAPAAEPEPARPPQPTREAKALGDLRILIIDDEPPVAATLARLLNKAKVEVLNEARSAVARILSDGPWDVIVCDLMMAGIPGYELYERVVRERPELASRFVFVSGGAYGERAEAFVNRPGIAFLMKPVDGTELRATVLRAAGAPEQAFSPGPTPGDPAT